MKTSFKSYLEQNSMQVVAMDKKESFSVSFDGLEKNTAIAVEPSKLQNESLKAYDNRNQKISIGIAAQLN